MPYITDTEELVMRQGLEQGLELGLEQGKIAGERRLALLLLEQLCGELDLETQQRIEALSSQALERLVQESLSFRETADLRAWLERHPA